MTDYQLNDRAFRLAEQLQQTAGDLRVEPHRLAGGGLVVDFGIEAEGGLEAGRTLAHVSTAGLATVALVDGDLDGTVWPHVLVTTDAPVAACLLSQYAGWELRVEEFFGMGSGPMRAAAAREELFEVLDYREEAQQCVGVLECARLPDDAVFAFIAERTGVPPEQTVLLSAPTSSQAGSLQVVARSVETALHKLFELKFDTARIASACGIAPLAPVAADDLTGIGRTNDAILYGGRVMLWVHGDDESLTDIGPQVPSVASASYGKSFLEIFEDAGRDFYEIDPHLFSPAEVVFQNVDTGQTHRFGNTSADVLRRSFGL